VEQEHNFYGDPEGSVADAEDNVGLNIAAECKVSSDSDRQVDQEENCKENQSNDCVVIISRCYMLSRIVHFWSRSTATHMKFRSVLAHLPLTACKHIIHIHTSDSQKVGIF